MSSGNLAGQIVARVATRAPNAVALRQFGTGGVRELTAAELCGQVKRVANVLRALGVVRGERVACLMSDTVDAAVALLGIMYAGGVAVPLSELLVADDVRQFLTHCGASVAIVEAPLEPIIDEVRSTLPALREVVVIGKADAEAHGERDWHQALLAASDVAEPVPCATTEPALLLYSAGFASESMRAVAHTSASVQAAFDTTSQSLFRLAPTDRVLSLVRLTTAYGLGYGLLFPLLAGAQVGLFPGQPRSAMVYAEIAAQNPTVLLATPSIYAQLVVDHSTTSQTAKPLGGLRLAVAGAESMPDLLIAKIRDVLGSEVVVGYGLTEVFQFALGGQSRDGSANAGMCGQPLPGIRARIVDDEGEEVDANEIGTLQLAASSMFAGYWPAQSATEIDHAGWFSTADRFMRDGAGRYHHCGRTDDLFKVGGKWVSPMEVERALVAHDAVWEAAVIGAADEAGLVKPFAFVVTNVGHPPSEVLEAELIDYVKSTLAPYKYPRWIDFVEALPRGPGGKILRYKLRPSKRRRRTETAAHKKS